MMRYPKRTTLLLCIAFFSLRDLRAQAPDSSWIASLYTKQEVMIPMRDGVRLFTAVYAPKDKSEKHPILMIRTPYSVAPYGKDRFSNRLYTTHWINYVNEKYIIVMQDVRGCYMSEGEFMDVRPYKAGKKGKEFDEASDAWDAIDWLVKNVPGNNGKVGVFGISYPGFYATMAAIGNHPALKAVSPQAPVTDWFIGDDFHHNGAFAVADGFSFYSNFGRPRPKPVTVRKGRGFRYPEKDLYSFHLKQGALKNYRKHMGDSIRFWSDLMDHPNYDEWWQARDARRAAKDINAAVLVVGGTFDAEDCYGAWNLYKAIEKQSQKTDNRLVMGPWFHGGWHRSEGTFLGNIRFGSNTSTYYQEQLEVPFFNYHLKGKGDASKIAEATVFFSGENRWRQLASWPPPETGAQPLYFHPKGRLSFEKPQGNDSFTEYTSDPAKPVPYLDGVMVTRTREYMTDDQRFAARRPDVLVFETQPLTEAITLAGPVRAELKVELSSSDADFVVKLIDVFPEDFDHDTVCCKGVPNEAVMGSYQMLVRGEIMRGKFRHSFEKPEPFTPGKVETVSFELPDVSHTFRKGHRLMVQVQSTWFPLFDRNPQQFTDIYKCDDSAFVPCKVKVLHQRGNASFIVLPVLNTR